MPTIEHTPTLTSLYFRHLSNSQLQAGGRYQYRDDRRSSGRSDE